MEDLSGGERSAKKRERTKISLNHVLRRLDYFTVPESEEGQKTLIYIRDKGRGESEEDPSPPLRPQEERIKTTREIKNRRGIFPRRDTNNTHQKGKKMDFGKCDHKT